MKKDIKELESMYSNYCEVTVIGKSVQGRNIYDVAIGNPDADQSLLVVSTLHAREYICSAVMMKEIEYYLENYNGSIGNMTPTNTLKNMQIHYIVMANPDGVTISQTKHATWKSNGRGVDLNRNFPTKQFVAGGKPGSRLPRDWLLPVVSPSSRCGCREQIRILLHAPSLRLITPVAQ